MSGRGTRADRTTRDLWVWVSLIPLGLGAWAPMIPGIRYRRHWWTAAGAVWLIMPVVGLAVSGDNKNSSGSGVAGGLLLLTWAGGAVTAFSVRSAKRRLAIGDTAAPVAPASPVTFAPDAGPAATRELDLGDQQAPSSVGATVPGPTAPVAAPDRDAWPWVSLLPVGLGSWAPIIAAVRCRVWWWALPGVAGVAAMVAGFAVANGHTTPGSARDTQGAIVGLLLFGAWFAGIVASFAIRPSYDARRGVPPREPIRWAKPSARSREWSARYALTAFVCTFAAIVLVGVLLDDVFNVEIGVGAGVLIVDALLLLAIVPLARMRGLVPRDLGLQPTRAWPALRLVVAALVLYLFVASLWAVLFISSSTRHSANVVANVHHLSTLSVIVTVFAIGLSAPIVEEIFFRGLLYRSLRNRLPVPAAALIAGLLFGLVHITGYPLITLPIKAAFGVIACLLYERTGSLLPGIALHSFVDASVVDLALTGNDNVVLIVAGCLIVTVILSTGFWRRIPSYFRSVPSFDAPPARGPNLDDH